MAQMFFLGHNLHGSSAKYKAWTYEYRIADFLCRFYTFFNIGHSPSFWLGNGKF